MAIKLVAIDIDGTLINDQREITPQTVDAIKKASAQGVKIVLCTGRPMTGVKAYLDQLGLNDSDNEFVISFNGALCQAQPAPVPFLLCGYGPQGHHPERGGRPAGPQGIPH